MKAIVKLRSDNPVSQYLKEVVETDVKGQKTLRIRLTKNLEEAKVFDGFQQAEKMRHHWVLGALEYSSELLENEAISELKKLRAKL